MSNINIIMRTNRGIFIISALLIAVSSLTAATNDMTAELQKGLFEEEANHNLEAAIKAYQSVISQYDKDRRLAATAIFRLAESYRKQGKTNEAVAQYQRVLREFSEQTTLTTLSSQNLAGLGKAASDTTSTALTIPARQEQKRLYEEEIKLAEKQLAAQQKQVENGRLPPDHLIPIQRDLLDLRRKLAALDSGASITETASANEPSTALTSTEAEEVKRIQAMIKNSPDLINARDQSSTTPLHRAATAGQLVVAEFLLKNGAETEAKTQLGRTPLHYAAAAGQKAMVELLLKHKANVQAIDSEGYAALHLAAENGMRSVAELLLTNGIDINAKSRKNVTPLHLATANSFNSVAALLIERNANLAVLADPFQSKNNEYYGTPLHIAASRGDESIAALLLAKKANLKIVDSAGLTPLARAVNSRNFGVAKQLLAHGADVNDTWGKKTVLHIAIMNSYKELVELLLENKADPNVRFDASSDPSQIGITPLLLAASRGMADIMDFLLAKNADPNLKSDNGRTPILEAFRNSESSQRLKMTKALLEHGANPNVRDFEQATPLIRAVFNGDKEIVELLLSHKAEVNAQDKNGRSALHWASLAVQNNRDMTPITQLLIVAGADVNVRDNAGRTPLQLAEGSGGANPMPTMPTIPPPGLRTIPTRSLSQGTSPAPGEKASDKMVALLRERGALAEVPRPDAIQIRGARSSYSGEIKNSTNDWNRFTFLEILAMEYRILTKNPGGESEAIAADLSATHWVSRYGRVILEFPNFEKLRIRRPAADLKSWEDKTVDVTGALASGDCSKDFVLEWGDVVEIAEADHPLNVRWPGFSAKEYANLKKCLSREIEVIVKGKSTKVTLAPEIRFEENSTPVRLSLITTLTPFWIKPALHKTGLLLASSDLAHIRVKRVDPKTGAKREWLLDCSDSASAPDFWLRDGDVIEVPDKT
jgi:ankyrin repeat protein